jgi:hypothetical protein
VKAVRERRGLATILQQAHGDKNGGASAKPEVRRDTDPIPSLLALCRTTHDQPGLEAIGGVVIRPLCDSLH